MDRSQRKRSFRTADDESWGRFCAEVADADETLMETDGSDWEHVEPTQDVLADVTSFYQSIRKDYDSVVFAVGTQAYRGMLSNEPPREYELRWSDAVLLSCDRWDVQPRRRALRDWAKGAVVSRCSSRTLSAVLSAPLMLHYTHVGYNVMCKDQLMFSNVPPMEDFHDEVKFLENLRLAFPEGVHGQEDGCGEFINDTILVQLMAMMLEKHESEELVCKAIFNEFPNYLQPHALYKLYHELATESGSEVIVGATLFSQSCSSLELSYLQPHFCRYCSRPFCCFHENSCVDWRSHRSPFLPLETNFETSSGELLSIEANGGSDKPSDADCWSGAQRSAFAMLYTAFDGDCRKIAKCLTTINVTPTSCSQACAYLRCCEEPLPRYDLESRLQKKKKH